MISHGKDIKIFTGNANPKLAADICKIIGTKLGESEVKSFADGEASVSLYETVRGSDVFLVQSTCKPVNDSLMELLIMVDACRRASAGRITAVMPYFGYARQDRKAKSRDPISAKLVANMLVAAGVDRVLTMDLHANQIQGFFDIPVDNLFGNPIFVDYYAKKFGSVCHEDDPFDVECIVGIGGIVVCIPQLCITGKTDSFFQCIDYLIQRCFLLCGERTLHTKQGERDH